MSYHLPPGAQCPVGEPNVSSRGIDTNLEGAPLNTSRLMQITEIKRDRSEPRRQPRQKPVIPLSVGSWYLWYLWYL